MLLDETTWEFCGLRISCSPADNSVELTTADGQTYTCSPQDIGLPEYNRGQTGNNGDKDDADNDSGNGNGNGRINRVRAWMAARRLLRAAGVDVG